MTDLSFKEEILLHEINKYCKNTRRSTQHFPACQVDMNIAVEAVEGFIGGIIAQVWLKISWSEE